MPENSRALLAKEFVKRRKGVNVTKYINEIGKEKRELVYAIKNIGGKNRIKSLPSF